MTSILFEAAMIRTKDFVLQNEGNTDNLRLFIAFKGNYISPSSPKE